MAKQMQHELDLLRDFNTKVARLERTQFARRFENETPEVFMSFDELTVDDLGNGMLS